MDNFQDINSLPSVPPATPPVLWTPRDVIGGLLFFGLWTLFFTALSWGSKKLDLPLDLGLLLVFGEAVLLIPVWYFTIHKYGADWADLGLRGFRPAAVRLGCGLMLLSLGFNLVYASLLGLFQLRMQPDIALIFAGTKFPLAVLFGGAIVAPLVEEIFFRGFIFAGLRQRWSWPMAALISAGLFALAHIIPTSWAPILVLGLIFAFLYQTSGSIWPAILMHMLTNSVALFFAYVVSQGWIPTS